MLNLITTDHSGFFIYNNGKQSNVNILWLFTTRLQIAKTVSPWQQQQQQQAMPYCVFGDMYKFDILAHFTFKFFENTFQCNYPSIN